MYESQRLVQIGNKGWGVKGNKGKVRRVNKEKVVRP